jgi:hypothetical protein
MKSEKRKTFVAREDLLKSINETAKRNGLSMYESINETLSLAIHANEKGINLRTAIEEEDLLKTAHERGFVLGLENLWFDMAELACHSSMDKAISIWHNAGIWFASHYSMGSADDPIKSFKNDMKTFTWNVPEFELSNDQKNVSVRVINPRFSESYANLFSAFIEGALQTLGCKIVSKEVSNGSVRITAVRK